MSWNARAWVDTLPRFALRPAAFDAGRYARFETFLNESGMIDSILPVSDITIDVTAAMNDYGKAFALMREAAQGPWRDYTCHAFVEGMKDGTLPREAFLHYLRQDYVFLIHFSRAWALAVVKSETHSELLTAVGTVNALISEEMQLHIGICEAAGISREELFSTPEACREPGLYTFRAGSRI